MKISLNVRQVVEHLYRTGDLTSELMETSRMTEGTRIHQTVQGMYQEEDEKEVFFRFAYTYNGVEVEIQGRADGVLQSGKIIEEIKSTTKDLQKLDEFTQPEHLAQAKFYAYFYLLEQEKKSVYVHLTYVHVDTLEKKIIKKRYQIAQLKTFFEESMKQFLDFYIPLQELEEKVVAGTKEIVFPFEFRQNQRKLMGAVYQTMEDHTILYAIAPTGTGKTIATLFSSLKTMTKGDKLFYLTAKNSHKTIAIDTIRLLNKQDLGCRAVELTAKDTTCFLPVRDCDPEVCPYAKDYFGKINGALRDIVQSEEIFDRLTIERYAEAHKVCPFEFSLALSNLSQVVVCDYNYAFDPKVKLKRFFIETNTNNKLLIDEAHNLVTRSLDMYTASLERSTLEKMIDVVKSNDLKHAIRLVLSYYRTHMVEQKEQDLEFMDTFYMMLNKYSVYLNEHRDDAEIKDLLEGYFKCKDFQRIDELYNENYLFLYEPELGTVTLQCMDAAGFIKESALQSHGTCFFSATMVPLEYYQTLLTEGLGEYIHIPSPFPKEHLNMIVADDVSMKYNDRDETLPTVVDLIHSVVSKQGNYIVFCPSYKYLEQLKPYFPDALIQERNMSQADREAVLNTFRSEENKTGIFVLGGLFSEGIDYYGDMLHGVIVLGVGLPSFDQSNERKRMFYQEKFGQGYAFAYTFPGFNKVVQAVGRVIRSQTDLGVALLVDSRYKSTTYKSLFPKEWSGYTVLNEARFVSIECKDFWRTYEHQD